MNYNPVHHYLEPGRPSRLMPLGVDVIVPQDYHLYLYQAGDGYWYAIVEVDHPFITEVVNDIESSFPVKVSGWCVLRKCQKKLGAALLPPNTFTVEDTNQWDDITWDRYQGVACNEHGMTYLMLRVTPNKGISESDLGLTWFQAQK